jgi:phosphoglucosamine mutase
MAWVLAGAHMQRDNRASVLIGMDTRASSTMLASALAAGLNSAGADAFLLGVAPTPAVSFITKTEGYDAGAMISASHNPFEYNGIKLFQQNGQKLPDALEDEIEGYILNESNPPALALGNTVGRTEPLTNALDPYICFLASSVPSNLAQTLREKNRTRFAFDCANGSASVTIRPLLRRLGFIRDDTPNLFAEPTGENINADCGSMHMERLRQFVKDNHMEAGFAFDGDADRLLAVDQFGNLVDGDQIIALCAGQMQADGRLSKNTAVVTVMSNLGFHAFCAERDIKVKTTTVGDRYVLEEMLRGGYSIGGEQSGHIIFSEFATAGDGQLTALQILNVIAKTGRPLSDLAGTMQVYPQVLINVRVSAMGKARCHSDPEIQEAVREAEQILGNDGRVLLRVSGTEPVIRVMLEGKVQSQIQCLAEEVAEVVKARLI